MNQPNASYETNQTLASAIYDALVAYLIDLGEDSPFYTKLRSDSSTYKFDNEEPVSKAYSVVPFEQLPEATRNMLYDLALVTVKEARNQTRG